jgi:putative oxidoreductase
MAQVGAPVPSVAAVVATAVELFGALAIALGVWTRPIALVLVLFTLGTAVIGHPFWTMEGADRYANAMNFYKNVSIIAGFLLLYVTGPGKYSLDARLGSPVKSLV